MIFELDAAPRNTALMRVIGVGGAGGNAVNRMIDEDLEGVEFVSANTDAQALECSKAAHTIQLGKRLTRGLGAGARPGIGRQAIAEDADEVRQVLEGADLIFITAGMGGGTGTGAAPVIGEMARELGALAIAVVTRPFSFEGKKRMRQADQGLAELRRTVDTMVVVPNDRLLSVVGKGTSFRDALKKADEVLLHATQGISDLIRVSGDVNVDFADVRTIMSSCGAALMGTGVGRGEKRAISAAQDAVTSPLLDNVSIRGAKGVLINITGGSDLAIDEVTEISTLIQEEAGDEAEIIFGAVQDSAMEGEVRVTLIATGFEDHGDRRDGDVVIRPRFLAPSTPAVGPAAAAGPARPAAVAARPAVAAAAAAEAPPGPSPAMSARSPGNGSSIPAPSRATPPLGRPLSPDPAARPLAPAAASPTTMQRPFAAAGLGGADSQMRLSTALPIGEIELPTFIRRIGA